MKVELPSDRVRRLMETEPMEKDPGIPRISIGLNGVVVFRVGHLFYAWGTSAYRLWLCAEEVGPRFGFWHDLQDMKHKFAFHQNDLLKVADVVCDHGWALVID